MRPWLEFYVPGLPIPQPAAKQGTNADGGVYRYVPKEKPIHVWRALVAMGGARAMAGRPLMTGPVDLFACLIFPRGNKELRARPDTIEYHTKKPDLKNLLTGLEDALKHVAWVDDCQNSVVLVVKRYTIGPEAPGTYVEIRHAVPRRWYPRGQ